MKVINYYLEYLYNRILDKLELTPNNITDEYFNSYIKHQHIIIDILDTNIISTRSMINNLRWNNFYRKYKRT